jgi:hypothetical protein
MTRVPVNKLPEPKKQYGHHGRRVRRTRVTKKKESPMCDEIQAPTNDPQTSEAGDVLRELSPQEKETTMRNGKKIPTGTKTVLGKEAVQVDDDANTDSGTSPPRGDDILPPPSTQTLANEPATLPKHTVVTPSQADADCRISPGLGGRVIGAHEAAIAYGEPSPHESGLSPERPSVTIDAHRTTSAYAIPGESRCHQYERRLELNKEDLPHCPFPRQQLKADAEGLWRVVVTDIESEFRFAQVAKSEIGRVAEIEDFIVRYEWLGSMPHRPTYYFTARTTAERGDVLVGAVVLTVPTAFSKLLGDDTKCHEAVIARGAVISWAPTNLNSWLVRRAIGWMAANTPKRLFVGYADPRADEIGTIYQSLNFYYLGQDYGAKSEFLDPESGNAINPIGDRHPRHLSMYRRYAQEQGIEWERAWNKRDGVNWDNVPPAVIAILRREARAYQRRLIRVPLPLKHKYVFVKGATPKETKRLRKLFEERNAAQIQPYPSEDQRGALAPPAALGVQSLGSYGRPKLVRVSDVQPEKVVWLWENRIPFGKLTLLEGDPDLGKSLIACDLAARVSTGCAMPLDTMWRQPAGVVILSAEDGVADTIRPRLEAAGADVSRIVAFSLDNVLPSIPDDLPEIERAIASVGAKLVIVDPLVAFLGERVRATNDQKVRRALTPLAALAQRMGVAILAIRHLTKNERAATKYRGGGSIGLFGAARAVLLAATYPSDPTCQVLVPTKTNLSAPPSSITYVNATLLSQPPKTWPRPSLASAHDRNFAARR